MQKLFVIGLDCFDPRLTFDLWLDDLPHLKQLSGSGHYGRLESTIPPITVPAWACMLSGRDPGELGCYGFRNRADRSYEQMDIATADKVGYPRVWDWVTDAGGQAIVVGVPQTYPVRPIDGIMVSSFLTPSTLSAYTHPPSFKDEIRAVVGDYMLDVPNFRTSDKVRLLQEIYRMSRQRFDLVEHLLRTRRDWDFFMFVDMGPDRIHHGLWKYIDPAHPKYRPGNPYENTIHRYYQFIDERIGRLLELLPDEATLLVMSDHGAQAMQGGICINDWLIEHGYLVLADQPPGVASLDLCEVDWGQTQAWGAGGYYGRIFLNIHGREPQGTIPPDRVEHVVDELRTQLEAVCGPQGRTLSTHVYRPEEIYAQVKGIPPDLIVYFGDLAWRSVGSVGNGTIHVFENDTGPDDANHAQHGMYVLRRPDLAGGQRIDHTWRAVAPTMLDSMGLPVPVEMGEERLS
ncbi:MAG TPA: alkaline phosphatase family protein [Anaerolineae bacterium]|nr:alkaline phosphatase family protein [Anaerolineae bacterium]